MATCETIDSGPQCLNWSVYAGDSNVEAFEFLLNGDPWNLSGAEILAEARKTASDPEIAATATITTVDLSLGQVAIGWDGEELRALLEGAVARAGEPETWVGVWDLQIHPSGDALPRTVLRGTLTVTNDVTRGGVPG